MNCKCKCKCKQPHDATNARRTAPAQIKALAYVTSVTGYYRRTEMFASAEEILQTTTISNLRTSLSFKHVSRDHPLFQAQQQIDSCRRDPNAPYLNRALWPKDQSKEPLPIHHTINVIMYTKQPRFGAGIRGKGRSQEDGLVKQPRFGRGTPVYLSFSTMMPPPSTLLYSF